MQQIQVKELAAKLETGEKVLLVDVRRKWEHDLTALANSLLIPLDSLPGRISEIVAPPGTLVVVYCHHGIRSLTAASFLAQAGFEQVASLAGGIDAWSLDVDPHVQRY